mgnify:FL=1|tara:strand:+ start:165 stop:560 length:396 start_codon:yes stop_codon:yes gene_type:complete
MIDPKIIKIALNTNNYGLKKTFTHESFLKNKKCGDNISIQIIMKSNKFISMRYETNSCIYCQASASLLSKKIKLFNLKNIKRDIDLLINSEKSSSIPKRFQLFKTLFNQKNMNRIDCIILPFNALLKALKV